MSKILILGANGMLGGSILRYFSTKTNHEVLGSVRSEVAYVSIEKLGFRNILKNIEFDKDSTLKNILNHYQPNYVLNCIGIIKQQNHAKDPLHSIKINSLLPHRIAKLCRDINAKLIHFSTDCVFSGKKGMYLENDVPDAIDLYGRSKLLGEVNYDNHLTLRTSIIGHELKKSLSLVDWYLNQKNKVSGYSRAIFSGMPTIYLAEFLDKFIIQKRDISGLYHLSVDPIDKYSLLNLIKMNYNFNIHIDNNPNIVINRSLNSDKLRKAVGFTPPNWDFLIETMSNEYRKYFK